jgi:general secretion pathway protein D
MSDVRRIACGGLALLLLGCSATGPPVPRAGAPQVTVSVADAEPAAAAKPAADERRPAPSAAPAATVAAPAAAAPATAAPREKPAPKKPDIGSLFGSLLTAPRTAQQAPGTPAPPPGAPPPAQGRFVVLNFDSADVETVVQAASEILGFNYVIAPDIRGKVTVQTSGRIAQEDVFNVLLAVLEVHGFTAVKSGSLYKIVRLPDAVGRAVPTVVGTAPDPARDGDEVITQVVPIRYANVNDLRTLLQPLVSPQRGNLIGHRETNVLVITDVASNVRRLLDIVRLVDVEIAVEEVQIIPLQFADGAELAQILTQLFTSGRLRAGGTTPAAPAPAPAAATPAAAAAPASRAGTVEPQAERPPLILPERRSNSLIVHARRQEMEAIRKLVARLDVSISGGRRIFIYYAENAKARDLADTLNAIYGGQPARPSATTTSGTPGTGSFGTTGTFGTGASLYGGTTPTAAAPAAGARPGAAVAKTAEGDVFEGQFRFIPDETTNAVIIATFPRYWEEFEQTLKQLDRSPRQVLIEVFVAEITLTEDTRLGIEWAIREGRFNVSSAPGIGGNAPGTLTPRPTFNIPSLTSISTLAGLNFFTFATDQFQSALNAFAGDNLVNVLSSPSILTSENKKASINVSTSIPVITSQQVPLVGTGTPSAIGTQTVEYRDTGVILTVTPRIGERGTIALDIKQEVNDVGPLQPPTNSPQIFKREAETTVVLLNNQTLVLGGLIKDRRERIDSGIPWLHTIPVIGYLFGSKENKVNKTELLILITPRVIGTAADAAAVTERMRRQTPEFDRSIEKAIPLPSTSPSPLAPSGPAPGSPAPPAPAPPGASAPKPPEAAPPQPTTR